MRVELVHAAAMETYRLSPTHPLKPERFLLALELARYWGLVGENGAVVVRPEAATASELLSFHDSDYVGAVRRASADPDRWAGGFGIGPGDTPAFAHMHEAAALAAGGTTRALRDVVSGTSRRAFNLAGGLHHAHRDRAAGFCVYNDLAIAIMTVTAEHPGLRTAYVDLDAHHGDGVQEAFYERADVLTVSVHESGTYLYPGSGRAVETGSGPGHGFAVNVPLPPDAGDDCYAIALSEAVAPALRAFSPDVIVAQLGADSHRDDPLTHLGTTVAGQHANSLALVALAEELCGGRIVMTGGGGYDTFSAVPRAWACDLAALLGTRPPETLPEAWRESAHAASGGLVMPPGATFGEPTPEPPPEARERALEGARGVVERLRASHPLLQQRG